MTSRLILPLPPSKNKSHKNLSVRRRVRTFETLDYFNEAGWTAKAWMMANHVSMIPKGQKIFMRYWVFWPDARIRDPGNVIEALSDSLKGIVFYDDQFVLPQAMDYAIDRDKPRVEVEFEMMPTQESCP